MLKKYEGTYIGIIIDPSCLPEYHINEPDFISAEEEYRSVPIRINFSGWRRHIVFTTG
jgi:hypothetical protein